MGSASAAPPLWPGALLSKPLTTLVPSLEGCRKCMIPTEVGESESVWEQRLLVDPGTASGRFSWLPCLAFSVEPMRRRPRPPPLVPTRPSHSVHDTG